MAAFKSTLQETIEADLLLHVIDSTDEHLQETIDEVERVIDEIGAGEVPRIRVLNKIDGLEGREPTLERDAEGRISAIWLSAKTGVGLTLIDEILREEVTPRVIRRELRLGPQEGRLRAQLYETATVLSEAVDESGGWIMEVEANPQRFKKLKLLDDEQHDSHLNDALIA